MSLCLVIMCHGTFFGYNVPWNILHFCHTCSLCRVELVVQFPARGSTQVLLCLFPGALWLWHFLYSVDPHPVSSLHVYTFVVSRAFMAGAASQAGDADSSRAPGLTSGLQGSVNVHRGTLLLVPQWRCISSFLFYMEDGRQVFHIFFNRCADISDEQVLKVLCWDQMRRRMTGGCFTMLRPNAQSHFGV